MEDGKGVVLQGCIKRWEIYLQKSLLDLRMLNQLIPPQILNQIAVRPARAAPGHVEVGPKRLDAESRRSNEEAPVGEKETGERDELEEALLEVRQN